MTAFTRLGSSLWDWEPWTELGAVARILWLALYTSAEAKRHVPGLWQGGIPTMADAARMTPDDVRSALDQLLEREMVEFDPKCRVLRLCELPDAGEYPTNGNVIRSWWTKFSTVPCCPVRDAHVRTIAWILETGSKRLRGKARELTANHQQAWAESFGTIVVPTSRRRGLRRLADSDTSTHAQPSLFALNANPVPLEIGSSESSYSQDPVSVDNSDSVRKTNEIRGPERVTQTVPGTVSVTNGIQDLGSRIPDLSFSSGEGGGGGGHENGMRPTLTLVPPYRVGEVLAQLAAGHWDPACDETHQNALGALIPVWVSARITLDDFRVLAEYSVHSRRRLNARWLVGCDIVTEIATARRTLDWRDVQARALLP